MSPMSRLPVFISRSLLDAGRSFAHGEVQSMGRLSLPGPPLWSNGSAPRHNSRKSPYQSAYTFRPFSSSSSSFSLFISLSLSLYISLSIYLFFSLSIYLSFSIYLSMYLSLSFVLFPHGSFFLSLRLSLSLSLSHSLFFSLTLSILGERYFWNGGSMCGWWYRSRHYCGALCLKTRVGYEGRAN